MRPTSCAGSVELAQLARVAALANEPAEDRVRRARRRHQVLQPAACGRPNSNEGYQQVGSDFRLICWHEAGAGELAVAWIEAEGALNEGRVGDERLVVEAVAAQKLDVCRCSPGPPPGPGCQQRRVYSGELQASNRRVSELTPVLGQAAGRDQPERRHQGEHDRGKELGRVHIGQGRAPGVVARGGDLAQPMRIRGGKGEGKERVSRSAGAFL